MAILVSFLLLTPGQSVAEQEEEELFPDKVPGRAWTLTFENDIFAGQDGGYTNGLGFSVAHGPYDTFTPGNLPGWLLYLVNKTYISKLPDRQRAVAYSFSQAMQTPSDISTTELQLDEPPYAGLLSARTILYAFDRVHSDLLTFTAGVVGEWSLAEPSQKFIHRITGSEEPLGWDNQLENEVVFMVSASHGRRVFASSTERRVESDLILRGTANLGTIQSSAAVSAVFRIGHLLELSHATASLLPDRQVNTLAFLNDSAWYAFVGAEVGAIANDIFMNGNTFTDSHSVPLDHTRSTVSLGVSWNVGAFAFTFLYAEVEGGNTVDPFGSFSVTSQY